MYDTVEHKQLLGSLIGRNIIQLSFLEKGKENHGPKILVFDAFFSALSLFSSFEYGTLLVGMSDNTVLKYQPFRDSGWLKKLSLTRERAQEKYRRENFFFWVKNQTTNWKDPVLWLILCLMANGVTNNVINVFEQKPEKTDHNRGHTHTHTL